MFLVLLFLLCVECSSNNCLFLLSKKFSTRVLRWIYVVVRGHPPITLCNKLPSRRKREKWLVPCWQGKFSEYLQQSSKPACMELAEIFRVHVFCSYRRETELRKVYCVLSKETGLTPSLGDRAGPAHQPRATCRLSRYQMSLRSLAAVESQFGPS